MFEGVHFVMHMNIYVYLRVSFRLLLRCLINRGGVSKILSTLRPYYFLHHQKFVTFNLGYFATSPFQMRIFVHKTVIFAINLYNFIGT